MTMVQARVKQVDDKAPILATIGTVIYIGLIARGIFHFFTKAPWPGFLVSFNKSTLFVSLLFWIPGIAALWMPKTAVTRLFSIISVFATLMYGIILRSGSSGTSSEGFLYVGFAAILCFVTLSDLAHRRAVDGSYLPGQPEPRSSEDVKDDQEPEPPIDEHRLVG
jgi:hypothetical protein